MTGSLALGMTLKGFNDSTNLDYVPLVGEVVVNKDTLGLKIGDGKTRVADLPYISSVAKEPEFVPSETTRDIIRNHKELIESNNFDLFYEVIKYASVFVKRDVTITLLKAGINIRPYLTTVPAAIHDLLLDSHNPEDASLSDMVDSLRDQLFSSMGIPKHLVS